MASSSDMSEEKTLYLLVDVDNLFFEFRSVLVNFLGTIANSIEKNMKSPWNYDLKKLFSELSLDTPPKPDQETNFLENTFSADSHLLRIVINSLLFPGTLPVEFVEESLSALNLVLENYQSGENKKLNTLCETFDRATTFDVVAKDGKVFTLKRNVLDNLKVSNLQNLLFEVLLLGWHKNKYLKLLTKRDLKDNPENDLEYHLATLETAQLGGAVRYVFLTSFKKTTEDFLTLHGFFPDKLGVSTVVNKLESLPKEEQEKVVKSFQVLSSNSDFVDTVSEFFTTNFKDFGTLQRKQVTQGTERRFVKVNLTSALDPANLTGTLGSFLRLNPFKFSGKVLTGHGRGVALLGIPTANLEYSELPLLLTGVYLGFATLSGNSEVKEDQRFHTVVSVGFNPHFQGEKYSVEAYLYHEFVDQFYGQTVNVEVNGYLRSDSKFENLEGLVAAIQADLHLHKMLFPTLTEPDRFVEL